MTTASAAAPGSLARVSDKAFDWERHIEYLKSSVRCKVEHVFRIIKCQFGYTKTVYLLFADLISPFFQRFLKFSVCTDYDDLSGLDLDFFDGAPLPDKFCFFPFWLHGLMQLFPLFCGIIEGSQKRRFFFIKFSLDDAQAFADFLAGEEKSPATVEKYVREVMGFAVWLGGRDLDRTMALDYKGALAEKRSPAGVNGAVAAVNALFTFLHMPECRIKAVKVQRDLFRDENQVLSENDYRRLLDAARKKNNLRLMLVMESICATGIRVSELRFFTVEAARMGRASVTNKGKTRTVFLPKSLQKKLIKYARQMGISAGPVFVTRGGLPLDRSNIWHEMKKLCKDAGVDEGKVFPHNLRHLFARTFYGIEKDIVRLADVLGHSSVNTTRIYLVDSGDAHRRLLEKMRLVV